MHFGLYMHFCVFTFLFSFICVFPYFVIYLCIYCAALPTKLADTDRNIEINECRNAYEDWS